MHLELTARQRSASARQVLAQRVQVLRAVRLRHQHLDVPAEDVEPRVPEQLLRGGIELADVQLVIHRDDGVLRGLENRALACFDLAARAIQIERQKRDRQGQ